ncbi:MAG: hypothetical protein L0332_17090 [Chloroflexi bacterium]|nr:hypothetical protein [Chloroflexota bacterium]MCI0574816.1 hypothetical protein [Chloroflexota bacterium]MCI0648293.1 hypothetical protein [Chloroflexota bacterium]MCI0728415.1 hypothetical protein [Chloroflexota bacterium]
MELDIKRLEEVWTADNKKLGLAQSLFHRLGGVDPELGFYDTYLEVENFEYGDDYYVPTDFIKGRDPKTGRVMLSISLQKVMERTWSRLPDFVAHGQARKELLPAA